VEYDFEAMLAVQGEKTIECVEVFVDWLKSQPLEDPSRLGGMAEMMDSMRYKMEEKLMESFSTPIRPPGHLQLVTTNGLHRELFIRDGTRNVRFWSGT